MNYFLQALTFLLTATVLMGHGTVGAVECETNCSKQCYKKRFGIKYDDPVCKTGCETQRQVACKLKIRVPNVPTVTDPTIIPPSPEDLKAMYYEACAGPFNTFVSWTLAKCKNYSGRMDHRDVISDAKSVLLASRMFSFEELNGVSVRWCPLDGAHGMSPAPNEVYIDVGARDDVEKTASILAHELSTSRQWRRHGESFPCKYSEALITCRGCQDDRNRFEKEAYSVENRFWDVINQPAEYCVGLQTEGYAS